MEWRRTEARIEEAKLERHFAELHAIDAREKMLEEERAKSEKELLQQASATGRELAALDDFKRYIAIERQRLRRVRNDCKKKIEAQIQVVTLKRRDVRLLEKLKEDRIKVWTADLHREIDQQAEESYLAKWGR